MLYKFWTSLALIAIAVVGWATAAFVMNWYLQPQPLQQVLVWLFLTGISIWGLWRGLLRIAAGQTIGDVLNAPWD